MVYLLEKIQSLTLSDVEPWVGEMPKERADRINGYKIDEMKKQGLLAWLLFCHGMHHEYGMDEIPKLTMGDQGKPQFARDYGLHFNFSHCQAGVLCGISTLPIGVDIQHKVEFRENLSRRICHENERSLMEGAARDDRLAMLWTAKESYLKLLGVGLTVDIRKLDFSPFVNGDFSYGGCYLHVENQRDYAFSIASPEGRLPIIRLEPEDIFL